VIVNKYYLSLKPKM